MMKKYKAMFLFTLLFFIPLTGCQLLGTLFDNTPGSSWGNPVLKSSLAAFSSEAGANPSVYEFGGSYFVARLYNDGTGYVYIDKTNDFIDFEHVYSITYPISAWTSDPIPIKSIFFEYNEELYCMMPRYDIDATPSSGTFRMIKYNGTNFTVVNETFIGNSMYGYHNLTIFHDVLYLSYKDHTGNNQPYAEKFSLSDFTSLGNISDSTVGFVMEVGIGWNGIIAYNDLLFFCYETSTEQINIYNSPSGDDESFTLLNTISDADSCIDPQFHIVNDTLYLSYLHTASGVREFVLVPYNTGFDINDAIIIDLDLSYTGEISYVNMGKMAGNPFNPSMICISVTEDTGAGSFVFHVYSWNPETLEVTELMDPEVSGNYHYMSPFFSSAESVGFFVISTGSSYGDGSYYSISK